MNEPKRLQLSRKNDYKKPEGAVNVAQTGRWGNPFVIGERITKIPFTVLKYLELPEDVLEFGIIDRGTSIEAFRIWLRHHFRGIELKIKAERELHGQDLACWCKLCDKHKTGKPLGEHCPDCQLCHADVYFEVIYS